MKTKSTRFRFCAVIIMSLAGWNTAISQGLDNAVGIRLGYYPGITFQHFMTDEKAIELIGASRYRGWSFTFLYEIHKPIEGVAGLKWYFGGGAHIGIYSWYANHPWWADEYKGPRSVVGIDGILGLEYFIPDTEFMVSADWKPDFNFYGYNGFLGDNGAFSVRYRF